MFWKNQRFCRALVLILLAGALCLAGCQFEEQVDKKAEAILRSPGIKWECPDEDTVIIRGGSGLVNSIFYDYYVRLLPTDQGAQGDWIHQVTFDCPEVVLNGEPIVFRFYDTAVQVDGQWYVFPEPISYSNVLEEVQRWQTYAQENYGKES